MTQRTTNHDLIAKVFRDSRGQEFSTDAIKKKLDGVVVPGSVLPNDHAEGNKSPCWCAGTEERLFDKVRTGQYRVR